MTLMHVFDLTTVIKTHLNSPLLVSCIAVLQNNKQTKKKHNQGKTCFMMTITEMWWLIVMFDIIRFLCRSGNRHAFSWNSGAVCRLVFSLLSLWWGTTKQTQNSHNQHHLHILSCSKTSKKKNRSNFSKNIIATFSVQKHFQWTACVVGDQHSTPC